MRFSSGAAALSVLSFVSTTLGQGVDQDCPYRPTWNTCTGASDFQCATIQVPKDWRDSQQGFIDLRLIRLPSRDGEGKINNNAESIIINPGGPGSSGIVNILNELPNSDYQRIAPNFHFVSFDPRGVGLNMPYKCTDPDTELTTTYDFNDDTNLANLATNYDAAADKCVTDTGADGRLVSTIFTARDVQAIAQGVGVKDQLIRYWVLGDTIAKLFPLEIGAMVLDGNINPNDYYYDFPVEEASDIDRAVERFFELCAAASETQCAWKALAGNERTKESLLEKFDNWVGADPTADNRGRSQDSPLTIKQSYIVRSLLSTNLKRANLFIKTAQVLQYWYTDATKIQTFTDDESPTADNFDNYKVPAASTGSKHRRQDAPTTPADTGNYNPNTAKDVNPPKSLFGISCLDSAFRTRPQTGTRLKEWFTEYNKKSKYAGDSAINNLLSCGSWVIQPKETFEVPRFNNIITSTPILFVQTPYDPVTPEVSGEAAQRAFSNSVIVRHSGVGHCSNSQPSSDLDTAIGLYFQTGVPPTQRQFSPSNPNPFIVQPPKQDVDNKQADGATPQNKKRDLSLMWPTTPILHKRQVNNQQPGELVTIELCDVITSTTTTQSSTQTSTQTGTLTTTGTGTVSTTTTGSGATSKTSSKSTIAGTLITTTTTYTTTARTTSKKRYTKTRDNYFGPEWAVWKTWKPHSKATAAEWEPVTKAATTTWGQWATTTTAAPVVWEDWKSQDDCVPVTKTICPYSGKDKSEGCKVKVVAIPTKTVYVTYLNDVCETGLTTRVVTVTATCDKGCDSKPTGIPWGYTTTKVFCSACATPATVVVTVKVPDSATWSPVKGPDSPVVTTKPVDWVNVPAAPPATPVANTGTWNEWTAATTTGAKVAKYTGGANTNAAAHGGLLAAIFAAVLVL